LKPNKKDQKNNQVNQHAPANSNITDKNKRVVVSINEFMPGD